MSKVSILKIENSYKEKSLVATHLLINFEIQRHCESGIKFNATGESETRFDLDNHDES